MKRYILLLVFTAIGAAITACDDSDGDADVDGDVDTDGDADTDVDGDEDVDTDVDGDQDQDEDVVEPPAQPSTISQTAGGGRAVSPNYNIQIHMGAPQPMGSTESESSRIRVGPASAPR